MKGRALFWVLLPISLVAILFLATVFLIVLSFFPPIVAIVCLLIIALVALWFFFARGRAGAGSFSEGSLMGRQRSSKEGLL
ncbi:hypothetical protein [Arthrobacter sp. B1I2]|uniref:hypothetical protein n=1 Tax=Arthrobacter sp. B1I2 TaxID=3042263 RepID=UPI002786886E|nr:hypothetical protein [Arthrobacter sp. B1I2]MDQ0733480.1 Flp pilus assembly protein TadB [Arthrobacter sp. B1I2]